jgi:hypothetical protein|tara:strand:+ start:179 stop:553 length:375 start_codon:yes stop_codon:yes gene_type:complete
MGNMCIMEVFDGKKAAQEYMSKHTLAFSTPELTLMRFAFWLGDSVPDPKNEGKGIPRMMTFLTEQDFQPVLIDDDKYEPSGAVKSSAFVGNAFKEEQKDGKFCSECGTSLSASAKFCPECGTTQ